MAEEGSFLKFKRVEYDELKSRQQENYNYQKLSAALADFGFSTVRLMDDWEGADFLAQHKDGRTVLRVQLKGRLFFGKKYQNKDLYIAFRDQEDFYLVPHDELLKECLALGNIVHTKSWSLKGAYSFRTIPEWLRSRLDPYKLPVLKTKDVNHG